VWTTGGGFVPSTFGRAIRSCCCRIARGVRIFAVGRAIGWPDDRIARTAGSDPSASSGSLRFGCAARMAAPLGDTLIQAGAATRSRAKRPTFKHTGRTESSPLRTAACKSAICKPTSNKRPGRSRPADPAIRPYLRANRSPVLVSDCEVGNGVRFGLHWGGEWDTVGNTYAREPGWQGSSHPATRVSNFGLAHENP
jgi:hypothetical protein